MVLSVVERRFQALALFPLSPTHTLALTYLSYLSYSLSLVAGLVVSNLLIITQLIAGMVHYKKIVSGAVECGAWHWHACIGTHTHTHTHTH